MPYFGDRDRRRGGYDRPRYDDRRDYGYDRGYDRGYDHPRYDDRRGNYDNGPQQERQFRFDIGQKVIHTATGMELSVVRFGREQLECRKPDLSTVWLYEYELEPVTGNDQNG